MAHLRWHTSEGTPQMAHLIWHTSDGTPQMAHLRWYTSEGTPQMAHLRTAGREAASSVEVYRGNGTVGQMHGRGGKETELTK